MELNLRSGKTELLNSIANYKKVGIDIEILSIQDNAAEVKITQTKLINGYILNQKQLVERVKEAFNHTGLKTKVIPVVYSLNVDEIDINWIIYKMDEFSIKRNDLIKQLAIDKSYLSLLFAKDDNTRKVNLSKPMKALFYYYFLTYELNSSFRNISYEEVKTSKLSQKKKFEKRHPYLTIKLNDLGMHFGWIPFNDDHKFYVKKENEILLSKIISGKNIYEKVNKFFDDIEKEIL